MTEYTKYQRNTVFAAYNVLQYFTKSLEVNTRESQKAWEKRVVLVQAQLYNHNLYGIQFLHQSSSRI